MKLQKAEPGEVRLEVMVNTRQFNYGKVVCSLSSIAKKSQNLRDNAEVSF